MGVSNQGEFLHVFDLAHMICVFLLSRQHSTAPCVLIHLRSILPGNQVAGRRVVHKSSVSAWLVQDVLCVLSDPVRNRDSKPILENGLFDHILEVCLVEIFLYAI